MNVDTLDARPICQWPPGRSDGRFTFQTGERATKNPPGEPSGWSIEARSGGQTGERAGTMGNIADTPERASHYYEK